MVSFGTALDNVCGWKGPLNHLVCHPLHTTGLYTSSSFPDNEPFDLPDQNVVCA